MAGIAGIRARRDAKLLESVRHGIRKSPEQLGNEATTSPRPKKVEPAPGLNADQFRKEPAQKGNEAAPVIKANAVTTAEKREKGTDEFYDPEQFK